MAFDNILSGVFGGITDWLNSESNPLSGLLGSNKGGLGESLSNPSSWWDKFKNGETNITNREIAEENLGYQRERNEIEDARYAEETAYNRAFAEDERAYNRALQEILFEREDTALERQASSLSKLGINPVAQQLNGLGAGQAVSSAVAPSASNRGGSALHNDFQMQDTGVLNALAPLASLANTINQISTGQGQRDLIRAQVDKQNLDNFITAYENGIFDWDNKNFKKFSDSTAGSGLFNRKNAEYQSKLRLDWLDYENKYKPEFARTFDYLMSDSFIESAEKALTKGADLFDKAFSKNLNDDDKLKFNPFKQFMNLFF